MTDYDIPQPVAELIQQQQAKIEQLTELYEASQKLIVQNAPLSAPMATINIPTVTLEPTIKAMPIETKLGDVIPARMDAVLEETV